MNVMTLGNMKAKIAFDQDAELFRGEILGLTGSADFYGKTVSELKREFKKSLAICFRHPEQRMRYFFRQHPMTRTWPWPPYASKCRSRVTSVYSNARAVATRMRSTGSAGGTPGRFADATSTEGGSAARVTPGSLQKRSNQISGLLASAIFPFAVSMAISQALMGDTKSHSPRPCVFCNSLMAGSRKRSPFAIQSTAQVSSRKAGIVDYRAASQFSPTGEVRSVPGVIVTVPLSAPKMREKAPAATASAALS